MKRYEYLVIEFASDIRLETLEELNEKLDERGKDGWELVSVIPFPPTGLRSLFYFKRPVSN